MPRLKSVPKGTSLLQRVPQQLVDQYRELIEQADETMDNLLEFDPIEDIREGKKALCIAAAQLSKKLHIAKVRGVANVLRFRFLSDAEYAEQERRAKERGAKIMTSRKRKR